MKYAGKQQAAAPAPQSPCRIARLALAFLSGGLALLGLAARGSKQTGPQAEETAEDLPRLMQAAFLSAPIGLALLEADGRLSFANPALGALFGCAAHELANRSLETLIHPDDRPTLGYLLQELREGRRDDIRVELRSLNCDSRVFWVRLLCAPIRQAAGASPLYLLQMEDYTQQKTVEEAFWEQILRSEMILQMASDGFCILNLDGRIRETNAAFTAITGFPQEELADRSLSDLLIPEHQAAIAAHIATAVKGGSTRFEIACRCRDQRTATLEASLNRIDLAAESLLFLSVRDVTASRLAQTALHESEQKSRSIVEYSRDGIRLVNEQGQIVEWNPGMEQISGLRRAQVLGRPIWEILDELTPTTMRSPQTRERLERLTRQMLADGDVSVVRSPIRLQRPDGTIREVASSMFSIKTDNGYMIGAIVHDITEVQQAQRELQESRRMLQIILDTIPTRVFWKDLNLRYLGCNAAFARDAGLQSPEQIVGLTDYDLIWRAQAEAYNRDDRRVIDSGEPIFALEELQDRADGTGWLITNKLPLRGPDGAIVGMLGMYEDITEKKRARDRLAESESRLQAIFNNAAAGITLIDRQGRFLHANQYWADMLGYTLNEIYALSFREITVPGQAYIDPDTLAAVAAAGRNSLVLEQQYQRKDGSTFWGRVSISPLVVAEGDVNLFVGMVTDISERKEAEQALLESERRYRGLFEDLPIALMEIDFSAIQGQLQALRETGVTDFRAYFYDHPEAVTACIDRSHVLALNRALLALFEADDPEALLIHLRRTIQEELFEEFRLLLAELAESQPHVQAELMIPTLQGNQRYATVQVTIAPGYEASWSRVIVSMLDVTGRLEAEIALRESEVRYKRLFEDVPISLWEEDYSGARRIIDDLQASGVDDLIAYFDAHPDVLARCAQSIRVVDVNRQTLEMYGRENKADLLGSLGDIIPEGEWSNLKYELNALAHGQYHIAVESQQTIRGQKRHIIVNFSVAPGYENTWGRMLVSITDISTLKQMQTAEHEQRTLAEALRDTAAALASSLDPETVLDRILDNVGRVVPHDAANFGLIENDVVRIHNWRGYDPAMAAEIASMRMPLETPTYRWMFLTGQPCLISDITQAGAGKWMDWPANRWSRSYAAVPIRAHGQVIGFLNLDSAQPGFFTEQHVERLQAFADQAAIAIENAQLYDQIRRHAADLQARVEARTMELEHERAQLKAILDAMGEGVVYTDNNTVLYVNDRLAEMLGRDSRELLGHINHLLETAMVFDRNTSRRAWVAQLAQALRQRGIWHGDVRLRRKDGSEFDASLTATLVGPVEAMPLSVVTVVRDVSQERALQAQKDRFIANASHELRTPITNLKTRLYLLRRQPQRQEEHLQVLDYVANRMGDLVEELLDISRFDRGVIRLERKPVALQTLVENVITIQYPTATQQGLTLRINLPEEPLVVNLDPNRITQVITNLVANAMNYTPPGGTITVSVAQEGEEAIIRVQDTGIGIPPEALPHIFEPFFRVSEEVARGTGLGLTISREIVDLHGGDLTVESEVGRGSTFTVRLPLK